MTRIAAVLVTHNSSRWIAQTLDSVLGQWRQPDAIIMIDDHSSDDTVDIAWGLLGHRLRLVTSTSQSSDRITRIASNFRQGLHEAREFDVAVLGDHDDVWHPNRIGHQAGILEVREDLSMIASNGRLVDADGNALGQTLRDAFPLGADWNGLSAEGRMRLVLRRSVATGGASAVRPAKFADCEIPEGWLHDRWWSLLATATEELMVDPDIVIDYRISTGQEVGLDPGRQASGALGRLASAVDGLGTSLGRLADLNRLARMATPATRPALSGIRLIRNLLQ